MYALIISAKTCEKTSNHSYYTCLKCIDALKRHKFTKIIIRFLISNFDGLINVFLERANYSKIEHFFVKNVIQTKFEIEPIECDYEKRTHLFIYNTKRFLN
jgi:uncharacterized CHY-type Zn-finger protein